ncbi:hypothetical protein GQ42DRAFT_1517 [Ramicandelaber brevisporus]|nr:hypothetical protein GQ42DRAFT_1517 [Ramicandelaber brevisporus]
MRQQRLLGQHKAAPAWRMHHLCPDARQLRRILDRAGHAGCRARDRPASRVRAGRGHREAPQPVHQQQRRLPGQQPRQHQQHRHRLEAALSVGSHGGRRDAHCGAVDPQLQHNLHVSRADGTEHGVALDPEHGDCGQQRRRRPGGCLPAAGCLSEARVLGCRYGIVGSCRWWLRGCAWWLGSCRRPIRSQQIRSQRLTCRCRHRRHCHRRYCHRRYCHRHRAVCTRSKCHVHCHARESAWPRRPLARARARHRPAGCPQRHVHHWQRRPHQLLLPERQPRARPVQLLGARVATARRCRLQCTRRRPRQQARAVPLPPRCPRACQLRIRRHAVLLGPESWHARQQRRQPATAAAPGIPRQALSRHQVDCRQQEPHLCDRRRGRRDRRHGDHCLDCRPRPRIDSRLRIDPRPRIDLRPPTSQPTN